MMKIGFAVVVLLVAAAEHCNAEGWSYEEANGNGPSNWYRLNINCRGNNQSPINIDSASPNFSPSDFVFTNYDRVQSTDSTPFTLTNSGHSLQVNVNVKDITVSGGDLTGTYILQQFHIHWGKDSSAGSEHQVDSVSYPVEIHLVHYNDKFADVAAAVASGESQALAVLGVFVSVTGGTPSDILASIAEKSSSVSFKGDQTPLDVFALQNILPESKRSFYRYLGSLTTPGCNEVVVWTVFSNPIYTTAEQLEKFRKLHENAAGEEEVFLERNYRPVQLLRGRLVEKSV